jgi:trimethylamine:corrinoid methyltransferase-like protein
MGRKFLRVLLGWWAAFGTLAKCKRNLNDQVSRFDKLPCRASTEGAGSAAADAAVAYDTTMWLLWSAVMGHANLTYRGAGSTGGLTAAFEKIVLEVKTMSMTAKASHALPAINRRPPPLESNWQNHKNWKPADGQNATQRAKQSWQSTHHCRGAATRFWP